MRHLSLLTATIVIVALALFLMARADDPDHPAPATRVHPIPTRNVRAAQVTNAPVKLESTAPPATNAPAPVLPLYIITELYVVHTPAGPFVRVDECDFAKLAKMFGGAVRLTNFPIYAAPPK